MKRSEFIEIVEGAMEQIERDEVTHSCVALSRSESLPDNSKVRWDYARLFDCAWLTFRELHDDIVFGEEATDEQLKEMRLNALAMYLAQSLTFKTYKDLSGR